MAGLSCIDSGLVSRVIGMNPSVRRLNLSHNVIDSVESEEVLLRLQNLSYLNLSHNSLRQLGPVFHVLRNLQVLDVSHNELTAVSGLRSLTSLRRLDLSHNALARWEGIEELSGLTSLQSIHLAGNPLMATLPHEQYEMYIRSIFPCIERVDDPAEVGVSRAPGSVLSVGSSARTLNLPGNSESDGGYGAGAVSLPLLVPPARAASPLSSAPVLPPAQAQGGGGMGIAGLQQGGARAASSASRTNLESTGSTRPAVPFPRPGTVSDSNADASPAVPAPPITPARPPSLPPQPQQPPAPAGQQPGHIGDGNSLQMQEGKVAPTPQRSSLPPTYPSTPPAGLPASSSGSGTGTLITTAVNRSPRSPASQVTGSPTHSATAQAASLQAQLTVLQAQLDGARTEIAGAHAQVRDAERRAGDAGMEANVCRTKASEAVSLVQDVKQQLSACKRESADLHARIAAQAQVLDEYEGTLAAAYARSSSAFAAPEQAELQVHAEAYGHTLSGLRNRLAETLVQLRVLQEKDEQAGRRKSGVGSDSSSESSGSSSSDEEDEEGADLGPGSSPGRRRSMYRSEAAARALQQLQSALQVAEVNRRQAEDALQQHTAASRARHAADAHTLSSLESTVRELQSEVANVRSELEHRSSGLGQEADRARAQLAAVEGERDRARGALSALETALRESRAACDDLTARLASESARYSRTMASMRGEAEHRVDAAQQELGQAKLEAWKAKQDLSDALVKLEADTHKCGSLQEKVHALQNEVSEALAAASHAQQREGHANALASSLTGLLKGDVAATLGDVQSRMLSLQQFSEEALSLLSVRLHLAHQRIQSVTAVACADKVAVLDLEEAVQVERGLWADALAAQAARLRAEMSLQQRIFELRGRLGVGAVRSPSLQPPPPALLNTAAGEDSSSTNSSSDEEEKKDVRGRGGRESAHVGGLDAIEASLLSADLTQAEAELAKQQAGQEAGLEASSRALAAACDRTDTLLLLCADPGQAQGGADGAVPGSSAASVTSTVASLPLLPFSLGGAGAERHGASHLRHGDGSAPSSSLVSRRASALAPVMQGRDGGSGGHMEGGGDHHQQGHGLPPLHPQHMDLMDPRTLRAQLLQAMQDREALTTRLAAALRSTTVSEGAKATALHASLVIAQRDCMQAQADREEALRQVQAAKEALESEKAEIRAAARRSDELRSKQVSVAKEASLRAKAQVGNLEARLTAAKADATSQAAEIRRLERELVKQSERYGEEHRRLLDELTSKLAAAQGEVVRAQERAEDAQRRMENRGADLQKLQEQVSALKRERNALIAALGQAPGGNSSSHTSTLATRDN